MDTDNPQLGWRPLRPADKATIENWPPYPEAFAELDYALRPGGWLDEFHGRPGAWVYAAEQAGELVAFIILAATGSDEAEFRIALHPARTGRDLGRMVAVRTLSEAFGPLGLQRIHLVVRQNNLRAQRLYQRLGFVPRGACRLTVNGRPVDFFRMDLSGVRWRKKGQMAGKICAIDQ